LTGLTSSKTYIHPAKFISLNTAERFAGRNSTTRTHRVYLFAASWQFHEHNNGFTHRYRN